MVRDVGNDANEDSRVAVGGDVGGNAGGKYDRSAIAGRDMLGDIYTGDNIAVGQESSGRKVNVVFKRAKDSVVTARKATIAAVVMNALTVISVVLSVFGPIVDWGIWRNFSADTAGGLLVETLSTGWWLFGASLVLLFAGIWSLRYAWRRRKQLPEVSRRLTLARSLYPVGDGNRFVRAHAVADCSTCEDSNRSGEGRIFRGKSGIQYRCKLGHVNNFNSESIFCDENVR